MTRFDGKVALLTGGASGVGRATAIRMAAEGASVFAIDVNSEGLDETVALVSDAGGTIDSRVTDVSQVAECHSAVADCVSSFGRLDVLANIAGVSWQEHTTDATEAGFDKMFAINVKGPFFLSQAAIPHLLENEGNIVNIASNTATMGMAYTVAYSATKGAIAQITRSLAMELVKTPVRVNAVAPGGIETPMTRSYQMPEDVDFDLIRPGISFRGMSAPEEIAAAIAFLASDDASSIHGTILHVDKGLTAG